MKTTVTKLDAAKRQLCCAIRMFFADEDAIAVYTLANAALEIFEGRPKKGSQRGAKTRLFDVLKTTTTYQNVSSEKEAWKRVHEAKNFFKHRGSLQKSVVFDEEANDGVLWFACAHYVNETALAQQPSEVAAFIIWFIATQAILHNPDQRAQIDNLCPGVRTASQQEQKRFGRQLIEDAVADRLPFRISRFGEFVLGANPVPTGGHNAR